MKQKGFVQIIILVLIVLAVVGYFGYKNFLPKPQATITSTPTVGRALNDDLVSWKKYTNTQLGYQISYPSSITVDESYSPNDVSIGIYGGSPRIEIVLATDPNIPSESQVKSNKVSLLKIDNLITYLNEGGDPNGGEYTTYYFYKNNKLYWIQTIIYPSDEITIPVSQILSTFKFTE